MKHDNVPTMSWGEFVGMIVGGIVYVIGFVIVTIRLMFQLPLWLLLLLYFIVRVIQIG